MKVGPQQKLNVKLGVLSVTCVCLRLYAVFTGLRRVTWYTIRLHYQRDNGKLVSNGDCATPVSAHAK